MPAAVVTELAGREAPGERVQSAAAPVRPVSELAQKLGRRRVSGLLAGTALPAFDGQRFHVHLGGLGGNPAAESVQEVLADVLNPAVQYGRSALGPAPPAGPGLAAGQPALVQPHPLLRLAKRQGGVHQDAFGFSGSRWSEDCEGVHARVNSGRSGPASVPVLGAAYPGGDRGEPPVSLPPGTALADNPAGHRNGSFMRTWPPRLAGMNSIFPAALTVPAPLSHRNASPSPRPWNLGARASFL